MTDMSGNTTTATYNAYGNTTATYVNGVASTASMTSATNFAAPDSITVGSALTTSMTYSSFLGVTSQTAPDTATVDIGYDSYARPTSSTSPFGATTYYVYNDSATPPNSCTSVNTRWTETILDGLGRTLKVLTGSYTSSGQTACASASGAITLTETDTSYGSCGCSPLGKMMSQTVPYTYGGSVGASTTYTYDGIGRALTVTKGGSDTTGETQYSYAGNAVTVTDPAGKVKVFTMDAFGNLMQVVENPSGLDYVSTYTYDLVNHLTGVSMTRPGFSTAQTRSFAYSGNNLTSATNPENGTVSYTYYGSGYNGFGKIATRTDAKGQEVVYTYDSYSRLSEVQRYPTSGTEDVCQREVYYYDGSSPSGSAYPANAAGRLSAVQYWGGYNTTVLPTCDTTFTEMYTYATSGAPVGKQLQVARTLEWASYSEWVPESVTLSATFSYDNEGRMTGETYPTDDSGTTANLSYTFDSMGRLNTMTDNIASKTLITGASYGPANELLTITGGSYGGAWAYGVGETRTYNSLKQLTEIVSGTYSTPLSITYHYPSTGNNGKIDYQYDNISGEKVSYTYDALNRLSTAANQSGFSPLWGQQFAYDGFGNLTEVSVTQGSAPTLTTSYDYNNHAGGEDSNGNPGSIYLPADGSSYAATYDVENRLVATGSSTIRYSYAPGNKRVWRGVGSWNSGTGQWSPTDEVTFWSVNGQKLATYQLTTTLGVGPPSPSAPQFYATQTACNYYFGGKLIKNVNGWVYSDRLASIGKFYPYGIERPSATSNGTEKFTGYFRDAETGNDYAEQRYLSPGYGRFLTPDRTLRTSRPGDPNSWNKYSYAGGDPINRIDRHGTDYEECDDYGDCYTVFESESDVYQFDADVVELEGDPNSGCYGDPSECIALIVAGDYPDVHPGAPPTYTQPAAPRCPQGMPQPAGLGMSAYNMIAQDVAQAQQESQAMWQLASSQVQAGGGVSMDEFYLSDMAGWLIGQFGPGGPWDFKAHASQYPGNRGTTNLRDFGNVNFGAVMESLGLGLYETENVAGVAQVFINALGLMHGGQVPGLQGWPIFKWPYGDSMADASYIQYGWLYQQAVQQNCYNP